MGATRELLIGLRRAPLLSTLSVLTIAVALFAVGLYGLVALNIETNNTGRTGRFMARPRRSFGCSSCHRPVICRGRITARDEARTRRRTSLPARR